MKLYPSLISYCTSLLLFIDICNCKKQTITLVVSKTISGTPTSISTVFTIKERKDPESSAQSIKSITDKPIATNTVISSTSDKCDFSTTYSSPTSFASSKEVGTSILEYEETATTSADADDFVNSGSESVHYIGISLFGVMMSMFFL